MKKLLSAFLVLLLVAGLFGCAKQAEPVKAEEIPFGEAFTLTAVTIDTQIESASVFLRSVLEGQGITVADNSPVTVSIGTSEELGEKNYTYRVPSPERIEVLGGTESAALSGVRQFCNDYLSARTVSLNVGMSLTYTDRSGETVEPVPTWHLDYEIRRRIADGVVYLEHGMSDGSRLPYKAYSLELDPQKVTLHTGTAENNYDIMPVVRQNVMEQMQASVADGLDVIAAVNGDFFAISSTFTPSGLSIKDGLLLTDNTKWRPYSAVTKDGNYIIKSPDERVDYSTLQMAVGGSHILVTEGQVNQAVLTDSLGTAAHPRTLAGVREDGTILLSVIDGRQPALSNGATYAQSGAYMVWLGAVTAINHDGGGSSTMILRNNDAYQTMNSPSDGNLRQVFCSIQVIKK